MSDLLQMKDFESCLEQTFTCDLGESSLEIRLTEVVALPPKESEEVRRAPFSLLFRGPATPLLDQRIYRLTNEQMGEAEIFLVPLGPKQEGIEYEAVFT